MIHTKMEIIVREMAKADFEAKRDFYGWEVFTEDQMKNYGLHVASMIKKSLEGDITESEQAAINVGKAELKNIKPLRLVEVVNGRLIKSVVYVQDQQVRFEETIEKSESGEQTIKKGVFIDTPLNRELKRVGEEFIVKGCSNVKKADADKLEVYKSFISKGIANVADEMRKSFPEITEDELATIKKSVDGDEGTEEEPETEKTTDDDEADEKEAE